MSGRCQVGIKRACWANSVASTQEIMEWAYPWGSATRKLRKNRARAVVLAARKLCTTIGSKRVAKGQIIQSEQCQKAVIRSDVQNIEP
jgi:hypothetical protein